jgi:hypothetical protein
MKSSLHDDKDLNLAAADLGEMEWLMDRMLT